MQKRVTDLHGFEKDILCGNVPRIYDLGKFPTAKKLALQLGDKISYSSSISSSLYNILKRIGFKHRETNDGRKFLVERGDIVAVLRTVHNLRITGDERPVLYLDETRVNQNHSKIYLAGLIKEGRLQISSRKREQAYCAVQLSYETLHIEKSQ
jgi:hypothetical protein